MQWSFQLTSQICSQHGVWYNIILSVLHAAFFFGYLWCACYYCNSIFFCRVNCFLHAPFSIFGRTSEGGLSYYYLCFLLCFSLFLNSGYCIGSGCMSFHHPKVDSSWILSWVFWTSDLTGLICITYICRMKMYAETQEPKTLVVFTWLLAQ